MLQGPLYHGCSDIDKAKGGIFLYRVNKKSASYTEFMCQSLYPNHRAIYWKSNNLDYLQAKRFKLNNSHNNKYHLFREDILVQLLKMSLFALWQTFVLMLFGKQSAGLEKHDFVCLPYCSLTREHRRLKAQQLAK